MDNWEQLKPQIEQNPSARKDLEEYVSYLVAEYMDKEDFRRTKLFREIEGIYSSFPSIQAIAEGYSTCFVLLNGIYTVKNRKNACKQMSTIYQQFPENMTIAENYAYLLAMCADEFDAANCMKAAALVENMQVRFPDSSELEAHITQIQENCRAALEYERLSAYTKQLAHEVSVEPQSTELISEYISALAEYASYADEEECNAIRDIVSGYCKQYAENIMFIQKYAKINVSIIEQTDDETACRLFTEVKRIHQNYPSFELAVIYSMALRRIASFQNSMHKTVLKELRRLYHEYPDSEEIIAAFSYGLYTLLELQNERAAKKTLLELRSLAEKYPNNSDIQDNLQAAKDSFAFDHEDAIFW